jgi:hypothetical protein
VRPYRKNPTNMLAQSLRDGKSRRAPGRPARRRPHAYVWSAKPVAISETGVGKPPPIAGTGVGKPQSILGRVSLRRAPPCGPTSMSS